MSAPVVKENSIVGCEALKALEALKVLRKRWRSAEGAGKALKKTTA
jgi:hypothetical protein